MLDVGVLRACACGSRSFYGVTVSLAKASANVRLVSYDHSVPLGCLVVNN